MATTTNFGWETPDDTDLVKDGAAAIRTLGSAIDTSLVDLKGGTTGQVLSKTSNTDMDFTWVAQDDSNAIQNAIVDAKGDLISATAADTPARLAVGTDGQVLTADSTQSTGLKWGTVSADSFTQIATGSLTGASVDITSIPGTYKNLVLYLIDIYPATDNTKLRVRMNSIATNYHGFVGRTEASSASVTLTVTTDFYDDGSNFDNTDKDNHIVLEFPNYTASARKLCRWNFAIMAPDGTSKSTGLGTSSNSSTAAISSIQISFDSGNISGGTYYLYGVK